MEGGKGRGSSLGDNKTLLRRELCLQAWLYCSVARAAVKQSSKSNIFYALKPQLQAKLTLNLHSDFSDDIYGWIIYMSKHSVCIG